jgi:hypothetical protein
MKMTRIREIWRRVTSTRYARALEGQLVREQNENARLRAENRALLNSILGIAGIPPVSTSSAEDPRSHPAPLPGSEAPATGPVSPFRSRPPRAARAKSVAQAAPMRRRSWQQINRTLELEAARKKPAEA